jgi:hypothetical protein
VKEWAPPTKRGRRTYSDEAFTASVAEQLEAGQKPVSERQLDALARLAARYRKQIPGGSAMLEEMGHGARLTEARAAPALVEAATRKLVFLDGIAFEAPRERRGRVYDDEKFYKSLRQQVESGRPLSEAQDAALNRLILRYAARIPNFEAIKDGLGLEAPAATEDKESGPLLEALTHVTEWREPVKQRGRMMDDRAFVASVREQYGARGALSPRQRAALKRVAQRYRAQIPDYDELVGGASREAGAGGSGDGGADAPEA